MPQRGQGDPTGESERPVAALFEDRAEPATPANRETVPEELNQEPLTDLERELLDEMREVQEYMAALLGRLSDDDAACPEVADATLIPRKKKPSLPDNLEQSKEQLTDPEAISGQVGGPALQLTAPELRARPPEIDNLDAMRELANAQTRAAIVVHDRNHLEKRMLNNAAAGIACLIGSIVALICAPIFGESMGIGRMAAVVASVYFLYVAFVTARRWFAFR